MPPDGGWAGRRPPTTISVPLSAAQRTNMRARTGSISKALAALALLVASIAVPALAVEVGALDALGFGPSVQAPSTPTGEVVIASAPVARRPAVQIRRSVIKKAVASPVAVQTAQVAPRSRSNARPATHLTPALTFAPKSAQRPTPAAPS